MWVEGGDIQDELLDQLGGVLAPPEDLALTPSAAELEALALAVAARWPDQAFDPGEAAASSDEGDGVVRRVRFGPRTRRISSGAWRAGSVAAGLVLFSASAAAAANGGVPLPRPVRVVAYTVGLPVDSPALDDTHQHIKDLNEAVKAKDKPKAEATTRRLLTDLTKVPASEKKEAKPKVEAAITAAANTGLVENPLPTTTTTAPPPTTTTTIPAPAAATTATSAEEGEKNREKDKQKDKDKDRSSVTTTSAPTTTTTAPDSTTTTTAPETDEQPGDTPGDPDTGDGHTGAGTGGEPGTTPTTVPSETTTTTTGPPPEETTTTTTTMPEPTATTTTTAPPPAAP